MINESIFTVATLFQSLLYYQYDSRLYLLVMAGIHWVSTGFHGIPHASQEITQPFRRKCEESTYGVRLSISVNRYPINPPHDYITLYSRLRSLLTFPCARLLRSSSTVAFNKLPGRIFGR
jgi:hypothetical protein